MLKKPVRKILKFLGLNKDLLPELWNGNKAFLSLYDEIKERTVVSKDRCFMLYQLAGYANSKEGEIAEVGVYKGGTGKLIAKACPNKKVHLFDTFSGMPQTDSNVDHHKEGDFSDTSLEAVKDFLKGLNNIEFHPGFFPATADAVKDRLFSLVYVDVDIYQSVKDCLEFFYSRMATGGVMIFDDYEWKACLGVKRAIDEFLIGKREVPVVTARYQCVLIKV